MIKCNICGWDKGWKSEKDINRKISCSCCTNQTVVEGINDIPTTAPWMVKFFQGGYDEAKLYTRCSTKKINFKCHDCGTIKSKPISIYQLFYNKYLSCICRDGMSYPEKFMYNILLYLNVAFEYQFSPKWAHGRRYDFYFQINNNGYIVETDGAFHKGSAIEIDKFKDKLAKQNNITIIRIDCLKSEFKYIKRNIYNSKLNELFDLSIINWDECERKIISNLAKEVCLYQFDNPNATTKEISNKFNLSCTTIANYLKIGDKFNWCNYYIEQQLFEDKHIKDAPNSRRRKYTKKRLEQFEENIKRSNEIFVKYGLDEIDKDYVKNYLYNMEVR